MITDDLYAQALAAIDARQWDVCQQLLRQLLHHEPLHAQGLLLTGRVLRVQGGSAQAVELYQRLLGSQPDHADALCQLAAAQQDLGQTDQSLQTYDRLIRLHPRHAEGLTALGALLAQQGRVEQAIKWLQQAVEVQPDLAQARHNLGVGLGVVGRLHDARLQIEAAIRLQPDYVQAHYNLGNILNRLGLHDAAIASFRRALSLRPDYFEAMTNLGLALQQTEAVDEAVALLRQAARLRPQSAEAFSNLGLALPQAGRPGEAFVLLRHAARLGPNYAPALSNLGKASFEIGRLDDAEQYFEQALRLQPQNAEIHANLGSLYQVMGRMEEALACFELALAIDPHCVSAHYNRGTTLLQTGDWRGGWAGFEYRFRVGKQSERAYSQPRWDGSPLAERTILLWVEQGLGDMIHFIRYAQLLKEQGATVILECPRRIAPLLGTCPGVDRIVSEGDVRPDFDTHLPLGSSPGLFNTLPETIPAAVPYLKADAARVECWRQRLGAKAGRRVGIAWQGNPKHAQDRWRSAPLEQFAPLAAVPGVELISLQQGLGTEQIGVLGSRFAVRQVVEGDLDGPDAAFVETAALVKCLDLVVTVDTALGHLAGALDVPVWLALSAVPDWRWRRQGERAAWYPSMRLFRQRELGQWSDVFQSMARELQSK
jgi:tetratricopeptide (TPR) repeat protein